MASTGIAVSDAAIADFNEFKKSSNKTKFLIFKIENNTIVTEHTSELAVFDDFLALLPTDQCRYAVYKMDFVTNDGRPNTKLVSIAW
jgi:cofilin